MSIEDFVVMIARHVAELDTDLEKIFRDADVNKNGYLSVKEFSKLITKVFPAMKSAAKPELNYILTHMSQDLRYVRNTPAGGVPEVTYSALAKAVIREGGATHPHLAAMVPPRPQPPPVMTLYVPVALAPGKNE